MDLIVIAIAANLERLQSQGLAVNVLGDNETALDRGIKVRLLKVVLGLGRQRNVESSVAVRLAQAAFLRSEGSTRQDVVRVLDVIKADFTVTIDVDARSGAAVHVLVHVTEREPKEHERHEHKRGQES